MKKQICRGLAVSVGVLLLLSGLSPAAASALTQPDQNGYEKTLIADQAQTDGLVSPDLSSVPGGEYANPETDIDRFTRALALSDASENVVNLAWNAEKTELSAYVYGDSSTAEALIGQYGVNGQVKLHEAKFSPEQLSEAKRSLFDNAPALPSGQRLFSTEPTVDGSGIIATFESHGSDVLGRSALPDLDAAADGIPVQIEFGQVPVASADRTNDTAPFKAGAFMRNSGGLCTTAFKVGPVAGGSASLISAHHCSPSIGVSWYQSRYTSGMTAAKFLGTSHGQAAGGSDIMRIAGTSNALAAWVYGGGTSSNSGYPVIGWTNPAVGSSVCYSGAFSGMVCQNDITHAGIYLCYVNDPGSPCYDHLVRTVQRSGIPAAGNRDSGGPVIQVSVQGAYATGVVSGIVNASPTCTGVAGGAGANDRKCSAVVLYAPLHNFFGNNSGWGLYTSRPIGG